MKYVYILQSLTGEHFYTGITDDLDARLSKHWRGDSHVEVPPLAYQELHRVC
jgi:predicted GIY-YIG superfamily endonuclease